MNRRQGLTSIALAVGVGAWAFGLACSSDRAASHPEASDGAAPADVGAADVAAADVAAAVDSGGPHNPDGGSDASAVPSGPRPVGLSFFDVDPAPQQLEGIIKVGRAADETGIVSYAVYFATSAQQKLSPTPIAQLTPTGKDLAAHFAGPLPPGAVGMLAVGVLATGESAPAWTTIHDGVATFVDLSAANSGWDQALVDEDHAKFLFLGERSLSNDIVTVLSRVNYDGTGLEAIVLTAGLDAGLDVTRNASMAFDRASSKLVVVGDDQSRGDEPSIVRCQTDGTSCSFTAVTSNAPNASAMAPRVVVDPGNGKLLVATADTYNPQVLGLFRCGLDGTGCTFADVPGAGPNSAAAATPVIDATNQALLIAGWNASQYSPRLFRCPLDASTCGSSDLTYGTSAGRLSGGYPTLLLDSANNKLLVVTQDDWVPDGGSGSSRPALFRCNVDGTGCTYRQISAASLSGKTPNAVLDSANGKLLIAAQDATNGNHLVLYRCALDGTGCAAFDMSAGTTSEGQQPRIAVEPSTGRFFIVASSPTLLPGLSTLL